MLSDWGIWITNQAEQRQVSNAVSLGAICVRDQLYKNETVSLIHCHLLLWSSDHLVAKGFHLSNCLQLVDIISGLIVGKKGRPDCE